MSFGDRVVGIVDYQAGNTHSITSAFEYLGARAVTVTTPDQLGAVTHVLLPGVGAFGHCARALAASGLVPSLREAVYDEGIPLLGICVGMQLLADRSEEMGVHEGLGWLGGAVSALKPGPGIRIPHVGWNDVAFTEPFGEFSEGDSADFYFDHSFGYQSPREGKVIGLCDHGQAFAAIIRHGNVIASQFHPEKSQTAGLKFLRGFLAIERAC